MLDIRSGRQMHQLGAFATVGCKCKSKSNILTNVPLRNGAIRKIEESGFGVQAICAKAPSAGMNLMMRGILSKQSYPMDWTATMRDLSGNFWTD